MGEHRVTAPPRSPSLMRMAVSGHLLRRHLEAIGGKFQRKVPALVFALVMTT